MPYIIIHSTNERIQTSLRRLEQGYKENKDNKSHRKGHPDLIGYKIPSSTVKVLKDTPATRVYAASLLFKEPWSTIVMFSENMNFYNFSKEEQELGKLIAEGKLSVSDVKRKLNKSCEVPKSGGLKG